MIRARRDPPRVAATIHDRRTGAVVATVDPTHGLSADEPVRSLPWHEIERRYLVRLSDPREAMAAVDRSLDDYDRTPRGRWEAQRRDVARLNALVADALGRLP